ncbi:MAG: hypothetical protein ABEJ79_07915 [Halolamina sp.]
MPTERTSPSAGWRGVYAALDATVDVDRGRAHRSLRDRTASDRDDATHAGGATTR